MKYKLIGIVALGVLTASWQSIALAGKNPVLSSSSSSNNKVELTIIHSGDFHGHLIPRPNLRSDGSGRLEGGLARIFKKIKQIRDDEKNTLYFHTGDTIQGGAEVLFTRGQAMVDILDGFGIDGFAPGNWEFVYGTQRFVELFGNGRWGTVAANVRYSPPTGQPCTAGAYVVPPYRIINKAGLKIGVLGFTTDRGPQVVGSAVTAGLCFLNSAPDTARDANGVIIPDVSEVEAELRAQVAHLRNVEQVDLLIVLSELGLANNALLAERNNGMDVMLSADMHEETKQAVVVTTPNGGKTIVVEEGQDGTVLGELEIEFDKSKKAIHEWEWKAHTIDTKISEDKTVKAKIDAIRKPFVTGSFVPQVNPFHGGTLNTPIDTVIGHTNVGLHRSNFSREPVPGAIEGTSHNFLTDAFRAIAGSQIGAIRGFRYGTHVAPGPVKLEDLYHFMPIGPQIARGTIKGTSLRNQIENAADGSFNKDVRRWSGGWLFGFSGVTFDIDLFLTANRSSNIKINGVPLDTAADYSYASYWYATDPGLINRVPATNIFVAVRGPDGKALFVPLAERGNYPAMDGTEVVTQYLRDNLGGTLQTLETGRVYLVRELPKSVYGNPEVQPLRGAQ